ncbi:regulatory protein RecX [Cytophaga hutchinsonii]|jgi:regulatory protein|uniref:Regulatory protein RecX n=1 Tax=Cytophaga hutchinsonii (strain ATCC 33406 / DSM 1761 / CIP 103989 / NBRC 15051 / NCIMB 9469 / D465) TaxID=269798 RepID=A0A6N4SX00_CYTH3|nr:regulatory protein RecX [Cytophaga hutchinsonii]ABG60955.1 regulatory protein RecX [Cytophaga hutchinsonii ATCC 33406]SFX43146.1 regulatory protein [Cytophaga hutchinsonii ATCC 33406]
MSASKTTHVYTPAQAFVKIASFCAYQERTQQEVRIKLYEYGIKSAEVEEIIVKLIEDNFLNEERFAKAFAGGKFRVKKWGRNKIIRELEMRGLSPYCIKSGLKEIEEDDYVSTIHQIIDKKSRESTVKNIYQKTHKIAQYLISRGFESDLVWDILKAGARD